MSKFASRITISFILVIAFSTAALAQDTHSVWSKKALLVKDGQTNIEYNTFVKGDAAFAWTESTVRAYAHAVAVITPKLRYDFMLIKTTGTTADGIDGLWDVRRNGVLVCNNCVGKAYLLSPSPTPPGNYFKIYVGTPVAYAEKWFFSGDRTDRFDF
jgi:hypothetical protein